MIIGYGYRRKAKSLHEAGAESVWMDTTEDRPSLAKLKGELLGVAIRPGDTLLVVAPSDLGRRSRQFLKTLAGMNVKVQVKGNEPVLYDSLEKRREFERQKPKADRRDPKKKMGRPRKFDPTPDQAKAIEAIWNTEGATRAYRLKLIENLMGLKPGSIKPYWVRDWFIAAEKRMQVKLYKSTVSDLFAFCRNGVEALPEADYQGSSYGEWEFLEILDIRDFRTKYLPDDGAGDFSVEAAIDKIDTIGFHVTAPEDSISR